MYLEMKFALEAALVISNLMASTYQVKWHWCGKNIAKILPSSARRHESDAAI